MKVKVIISGQTPREFEVGNGATMEQVLQAAGQPNGYMAQLNGTSQAGWTPVQDGDVITVMPKVEGGC